jgi:hypothetical protein
MSLHPNLDYPRDQQRNGTCPLLRPFTILATYTTPTTI